MYVEARPLHSFAKTTATTTTMKQYSLSEDRVVVVKKSHGQQTVIIKQKDSDVKFAEFTPNRYDIVLFYVNRLVYFA